MTGEDIKSMGERLAALDEFTRFIKETSERQEKAMIDIFHSNNEMNAKMASLETVIRMSISQQKTVNVGLQENINKIEENWGAKEGQIDTRMRMTERRIAYFAGGVAVALLVFDLIVRFIMIWAKGKFL